MPLSHILYSYLHSPSIYSYITTNSIWHSTPHYTAISTAAIYIYHLTSQQSICNPLHAISVTVLLFYHYTILSKCVHISILFPITLATISPELQTNFCRPCRLHNSEPWNFCHVTTINLKFLFAVYCTEYEDLLSFASACETVEHAALCNSLQVCVNASVHSV
jgi:hypothetical protein